MPAFRETFIFLKRQEIDDEAGNYQGDFQEQFTCRGNLIFKQGSEAVIASRLVGKIPAFLKIRKSSASDQITTDWCAQDRNTGVIYNIRAKTLDTTSRLYYLLTLEGGVAP